MNLSAFAALPALSRSARILTSLLAIGFPALGIREVVSPWGWDASFGVPLTGKEGLSFVRAVAARNAALSSIALFAAATGAG